MKKYLASLLTVVTALNIFAAVKIETTKVCGLEAKIIENKFLRFTVIPAACGRISSIFLKGKAHEMLLNYSETRRQEDPLLPEMVFSNFGGIKEWFWQKKWKNLTNSAMVITDSAANEKEAKISLFSRGYMSSPIQMAKTCLLEEDCLKIEMNICLKNTGRDIENFSLWINSIPNLDTGSDCSIIPIAGNTPYVNKRPTLSGKRTEIWRFEAGKSFDKFIAPGAGWNAIYLKKINTIMLLSVSTVNDLIPGGMFYMWRGRIDGKEVVTQEIMFPPLKLGPAQEKQYSLSLMIFPGMSEINALSGDTAIFMKEGKNEIVFKMNSAGSHPKRMLSICRNDKITKLAVPPMLPGKNTVITAQIPAGEQGKLRYYLDGQEFYPLSEKE